MDISQLEEDFDWREAEIAHLKVLYTLQNSTKDMRYTILKSLILLRYAHFEGFIRLCINSYIDYINKKQLKIKDLKKPYSDAALQTLIVKVKKNMSATEICDLLQDKSYMHLDKVAYIELYEDSRNLWPNYIEDILNKLNIKCNQVSNYNRTIGALIGIRNDLAHGKQIRIRNLDDYEIYENAALTVSAEILISIQSAYERQIFSK